MNTSKFFTFKNTPLTRISGFSVLFIIGLLLNSASVQAQNPCPAVDQTVATGATLGDSDTNGFCFGCSVSGEGNLIDANTSNAANISIPVGVGGSGYVEVEFDEVYPAGTRAGFIADVNGGIAGLFNGTSLTTYLNGVPQETISGGSLVNIIGIGGNRNIAATFCQPFDEIRITAGSLAGLFANYEINNAFVVEDCTFPVACGAPAGQEICGDGIDNDGDFDVDENPCAILDADGDGVDDNNGDTDPANPCIPMQGVGYTGFDSSNPIWAGADCDGDGNTNGAEVAAGSDPYCNQSTISNPNGSCFCNAGNAAPILISN